MTHRPRRAAAALVLVGALGLAGCSGDAEGSSETVTVTADAPAESDATTDAADGETDAESTDESGAEETDAAVEPAEAQTIEIGEEKTYSGEKGAYTMTVHRAVVNDYYVEAEITIINDGDSGITLWSGGNNKPRLFDDRGRDYGYQLHAGADGLLRLEAGAGMDAVLVFSGAVDETASSLTLDFSDLTSWDVEWNQVTFDIPLGGQ